jgi:fructose-1,6-bisphosphatase
MVTVTSYFEIDARAEMAFAVDNGQPCEAYLKVATDHSRELTAEEIEKVHELHKAMVAEQLELPTDYIRCITEEEYLRQTEDGDER